MYMLIKSGLASMEELKSVYTLDEALKLFALYQMDKDIEAGQADKMRRESKSTRRR